MAIIFEFHISRRARDRYQFDETLFSTDPRFGGIIFSDFGAARRFAETIYAVSGRLIPASEIYAIGLIDEIMHLLIRRYESQNPGAMARALGTLGDLSDQALTKFTDAFPPTLVYRGGATVEQYLSGTTDSFPHRQVAMEEMLLLNIANHNPALEPYDEFFDDSVLVSSGYLEAIRRLRDFFATQPALDGAPAGSSDTLFELLLAPSRAAP